MPTGETPGPGEEESAAEATVLRMLLGAQLRRLREEAGISAEKAGYSIRGSRSKISRMETGRVGLKIRDVEDLLTLYGVVGERERAKVIALAKRSREPEWWTQYNDILPDWFETYLGLESAATAIRTFEMQFVPGLFQTEDYARAITRLGHQAASAEEIERRVSLRLNRQQLLLEPGPSPTLWAVIDESALRRPLGGREVMQDQIRQLAELTERSNIILQVVPFDRGGHSAVGGSFSILRFADPELPDIVYLEQLTSALYLDRPVEVDQYREVMNSLSAEAETPAESQKLLKRLIGAE